MASTLKLSRLVAVAGGVVLLAAFAGIAVDASAQPRQAPPAPQPAPQPSARPSAPAPQPQPPARKPPNAEVLMLLGTTVDAGGSMDPRLDEEVKRKLRQEPLTLYNTYKLLDSKVLPLEQKVPVAYAMVNRSQLMLTMLEPATGEHRYKLQAEVSAAGGGADAGRPITKIDFTSGPKNYFFLGPFRHAEHGALFLVITIKK